jgi:hypothetical protein
MTAMTPSTAATGRPAARRGAALAPGRALVSVVALLVAATALGAGCSTRFDVERRETPVHIWLSIPGLATSGGQVDADIAMGPYRVVRDVVTFPRGVPTVELPTVYAREGAYVMAVRLARSGIAVQQTVEIEGESWIQIVVTGQSVEIDVDDNQPEPPGR